MTIADSATVTLDGLIISGGYSHGLLTDDPLSGTGAGIYVDSDGIAGIGNGFGTAYLMLRNLTVAHNDALGRPGRPARGGGLWQLFGTLSIDQSVFDDNSAPDEGGAFVAGEPVSFDTVMDSVVITRSSFTNNTSTRLDFGFGSGVLEMSATSFDIEANTFSHNAGGEGAFQLFHVAGANAPSKRLIANNTFSWNSAAAIGLAGALELLTGFGGPLITVQGNTFTHNNSPVFGGALLLHGKSDYLIDGNTFTHNSAGVGGGAVYVNGATGSITIRNGQFVQNAVLGTPIALEFLNFQAGQALYSPALQVGGGAIAIDDGSNVRIQGSMFNGNTAPFGGAISVVGYGYLAGPPWDYTDGLPDFSGYTETANRPASATISNSTFLNNQAITEDGGAIFAGAVTTPAVPFQGGTFPAITSFGPTAATVTGSSFQQDVASAKGGAIAGEHTTATVAQNTFFKDLAPGGGDHLYFLSATVNSYSTTTQASQALQSLQSTNSYKSPSSGLAVQ